MKTQRKQVEDRFTPPTPIIREKLRRKAVEERPNPTPEQAKEMSARINQHLKMDLIREAITETHKWLATNTLCVPLPVVVSFDWHIPRTSQKWVEKLVSISFTRKIPRLIIGGDFFDQEWWKYWMQTGPEIGWDQEIAAAEQMLDSLLRFYEKIYIFLGNHDLRLWTRLGKRYDAKNLFKSVIGNHGLIGNRIFISNLEFCYTEKKEWMICHPGNYSVNGTTVPVAIADINEVNTIGGHGHHLGCAKTKNGHYWGIEGGGMFDERSMTYNGEVRKTKHPRWNNGFVVLNENGEARLYGDDLEM